MLVSVQPVRQYAALVQDQYVTGDGPGSLNPVDCRGANRLLLFVHVERIASADYHFRVEFLAGADDPYLDSSGDPGATVTLQAVEFVLDDGEISTDQSFVISMPVHGRYARVAAKYSSGGSDPSCSITAATATTLGGRGRIYGLFQVKEAGAMSLNESVTGDGPGSENAVPISRSDHVHLMIDAELGTAGRPLEVYMETSLNGSDYYRETWYEGGDTFALTLKTYQLMPDLFGGVDVAGAVSLGLEALGTWARFTFTTVNQAAANAAAQALVGRV